LAALHTGRDDATLRVLEVKSIAAQAASEIAAHTTDALHNFVGRLCLGLPLFDAAGAC
jgi:hypothetical protein